MTGSNATVGMPNAERTTDEPKAARRAILVLGPHRSGTSVVTRALQCTGADLGRRLLEPNDDNPKGFFENASVVTFNDRLLKHIGICWDYLGPVGNRATDALSADAWLAEALALIDAEFGASRLIAIKDPRLCLLAPFWAQALSSAGFDIDHILVLRHPGECASSQGARQRRDPAFHFVGDDLESGLLLWARYMHEALRHLANRSMAIASYQRFVSDPERELSKMASALDLQAEPSAVQDFSRSFLDPALHRHHGAALDTQHESRLDDFVRIWQTIDALDSAQRHQGAACSRAAEHLGTLLTKEPEFSQAMSRAFVHARHAAVEAGLELAHAKRIIAFQEHALGEAARRAEEFEARANAAEARMLEEHAKAARAALENATLQDRLGLRSGSNDGKRP